VHAHVFGRRRTSLNPGRLWDGRWVRHGRERTDGLVCWSPGWDAGGKRERQQNRRGAPNTEHETDIHATLPMEA
jgi:hypothetical protein